MIRRDEGRVSGVKCPDLFSSRIRNERSLAADVAFDRKVRAAIVVEMHSGRDSSLWAFRRALWTTVVVFCEAVNAEPSTIASQILCSGTVKLEDPMNSSAWLNYIPAPHPFHRKDSFSGKRNTTIKRERR